jgi:hypothetical protein
MNLGTHMPDGERRKLIDIEVCRSKVKVTKMIVHPYDYLCDTDSTTRQIRDKVVQHRLFFSYWPTLIQPISVFRILSRFYLQVHVCINNKIETLCHCRLMI